MPEERCIHEMLAGTCSICKPVEEGEGIEPDLPGLRDLHDQRDVRWFIAQFRGRCAVCGDDIEIGDWIRRMWIRDDTQPVQYIHEECD